MHFAKVIVLSLLGTGAGSLLIWGPRSEVPVEPGYTQVDYWEKWTGEEGKQMQQIVDDFNNSIGKAKKIHVQYLAVSNVDQKTLVATAAGDPPDIAGVWDNQLAQWAATDALEPLDDLVKNFKDYDMGEGYYKPVYWDACHFNNKLYCLISTPAAIALQYNRRVFMENAKALRDAGCDPTRGPRTLEELDKYSAVLDQKDRSVLTRVGFSPMEPGWYAPHLPFWFEGQIYDYQTLRATLDTPQAIQSMTWLKSYSTRLGAQALSDYTNGVGNFATANNPFLTGQSVMELYGPWTNIYILSKKPEMNHWKDLDAWKAAKAAGKEEEYEASLTPAQRADNAEWGAVPFPSSRQNGLDPNKLDPDELIDKGTAYCCFDILAIPAGAKHKKEAFEFIAYVNRRDVMQRLCSLKGCNTPIAWDMKTPAGRAEYENYLRHHPNPCIDVYERLAASPNAVHVPNVPLWPEVWDEMKNACQDISMLKETPENRLKQAQQTMQSKLDQYYDHHPENRPKTVEATGGNHGK